MDTVFLRFLSVRNENDIGYKLNKADMNIINYHNHYNFLSKKHYIILQSGKKNHPKSNSDIKQSN